MHETWMIICRLGCSMPVCPLIVRLAASPAAAVAPDAGDRDGISREAGK